MVRVNDEGDVGEVGGSDRWVEYLYMHLCSLCMCIPAHVHPRRAEASLFEAVKLSNTWEQQE